MIRFLAAVLAIACSLQGAIGRAQVPRINLPVPGGIAAGQPVEVTFTGEALANPTGLWTNLPGTAKLAPDVDAKGPKNGTLPTSVTYRLELPSETPPGIYAVRLATGQGISNLRLLVVDDLPTVRATGSNISIATAQELQLPVAVEGAAKAESRQYYKFRAEQGQRLSVEVLARRLGSALDPFIRLLDAQGRELAYRDDDEAIGADSRLVHRFAAAGEYVLEIGDVRYQGSAEFRYRLRLGDFPLLTAPFPLGVQQGSVGRIELAGVGLGELPALEAHAPLAKAAAPNTHRLRLKAEYPHGHGSSAVTVLTGPNIEQVEFEPNDRLETASPVEAAGAVNGRFAQDHDRDCFKFTVKKGQPLRLLGRTRSLGIARDLLMRLFDAQGKQLAQSLPTNTDESQIEALFPEDGLYTLVVEDLLGRGGPDHVYRVEFGPPAPRFSLAPDADRYNVPRGGVFQIKVAAVRNGYTGPIDLALAGSGAPFKLAAAAVPEGKLAGILTVTVPESLSPGSWHAFQLVGRATIDKSPVEVQASSLAVLRTALNGTGNPPAELDGALILGIGPVFPDFIKLDADDKTVTVPQLAGKASFEIKATRLEKFDGPIALVAEGLPPGFSIKEPKAALIAKGKSDIVLEVTAPLAAAEGEIPFRIVGSGTHALQPGRALLDLTLRIVKPVSGATAPDSAPPAIGTDKSIGTGK